MLHQKPYVGLVVLALALVFQANDVHAQDSGTESKAAWQANSEIVENLAKRRSEFNYYESEVPVYELPDPLVRSNGTRVTSQEQWPARRAELMELFREQVYGRRPVRDFEVDFIQTAIDTKALGGTATGRSMIVKLTIEDREFTFPFVSFVPNGLTNSAPLVVHINNRYFIPLEKANTENDPFWPAKTLVQRGYATASFHTSDVDPDRKDGYSDGVRSFFAYGKPPEDTAWRSLSAWGWAASQVLDFHQRIEQVDTSRAAVVGHSRGGKTALWAACEDSRFAIAYSNNSGCGGAALSRRAYGETVERITSSFPHWFCKNFASYAGRESELPVDQHEVIALIAPRAAYVASADEDLWADPKGEYASLVAAEPVFRLFDLKAIHAKNMPPMNSPRIVGRTGYHIRSGGHGLGDVDWKYFLDFADAILK